MIFLNNIFESGSSYSTINAYKSALAFIFKIPESDNTWLKRYLKGIYNKRPSAPKYQATWDPHAVLKYLEKLFPLENLYQIFLKLVTLLALTTGHRMQTFSQITVPNINILPDSVTIRITDRIKTSGINKYQPLLVFPIFKDKPEVCVANPI